MTKAKICAVVKADAYGHGLPALAAFASADEFAVSSAAEAEEVRAVTDKPINVLSPPDPTVPCAYGENVYPGVATAEDCRFVAARGATCVNLKLNTGMNRYGCAGNALSELLRAADGCRLRVKSVYSHVRDLSAAELQFEEFLSATEPLCAYIPERHILASNFVLLPSYMHMDMVRPGIVLYGYGHERVQSAVTATCGIAQVRTVRADEYLGYGAYRSDARRTVAVLSAGYADGIRRIRGNAPRYVQIHGKLCPIVGQVCMDATLADVTGLDVRAGDTATVLGNAYGAEAAAASCETIAYEILTGLGKRVLREYTEKETV